ncbi:HipA domain-containing protein [Acinetobacter venetianus]|nr:HipA domain-containing protein [Acinetobacter venetianus]
MADIEFYTVHDISQEEADSYEQLGTKSKFWYFESNTNKSILFKSIRTKEGDRFGEDWAEKIACELAERIGLPHANYDLAIYNNERGVISPNFITEKGQQLLAGNLLLQDYLEVRDKNPNIQYIDHVHSVMTDMIKLKPINFKSYTNIRSASEFFVGYLMFDALISNQDRHNENWGMVTSTGGSHLAPSYDHGASLARNESDEERAERLETKDKGRQISQYVKRALSQFHSPTNDKRIKLLDAFLAYGLKEKDAALAWLKHLEVNITDDVVVSIIEKVPQELMSKIAKEFTIKLVLCNRTNLLGLRNEFL